jgi:hypothetical protein
VAGAAQMSRELLLEREAAVIGAEKDAHKGRL